MKQQSSRDLAKNVLKATSKALKDLDGSLVDVEKAIKLIHKRKGDVIVTGIGKSRFVGEKFVATLTSLGVRAFFIHPTEALHGDLGALSKGDVLVSLSYSGESKEVVGITRYAKKHFKVPVVAVCKSDHSSLGLLADVCVKVTVKDEGSPNKVAPMASTTTTLVVTDMIAAGVMQSDFDLKDFATYHPGGALGLRLKKVDEFMQKGKNIPKIQGNKPFLSALQEITDKKKGITAVVDKSGFMIGVISDGDIRRFLLRTRDISKSKVEDAMTVNPKSLRSDDTLEGALLFMERNKITSIFVIDSRQKLVGILHIHDILENVIMQ